MKNVRDVHFSLFLISTPFVVTGSLNLVPSSLGAGFDPKRPGHEIMVNFLRLCLALKELVFLEMRMYTL